MPQNISVGSIVKIDKYNFVVLSVTHRSESNKDEEAFGFILEESLGGLHLLAFQWQRWNCSFFFGMDINFLRQEESSFFFEAKS
jgi:hypothetical protein